MIILSLLSLLGVNSACDQPGTSHNKHNEQENNNAC